MIVTAFEITEVPNVDRIQVYIEDQAPGRGRITIASYERAWTSFWNAMSG